MYRCTSPIRTAHGSTLSDKKLHLDQKMANGYYFAQGRALGSISRRKYTAVYLADCRQKLNTRPIACLHDLMLLV